jgi:homoaconitase/3-isopropylmalate dehydratase large subunit
MGHTMTEKILARASGQGSVSAGDTVLARIAMLTNPDWTPFIDRLRAEGLKVWDPARVIFCFDHFFQPDWIPYRAALEHPKVRAFAKEQGVPDENVYDIGRNGISHHIPVEQGYALPGTVCIGADTQSAMMGAVNCFAMPVFASVEYIVLNGEIWLIVPEAVRINLTGALPRGMSGKDFVYRLIRDLGGKVDNKVLEFSGPGVANLSVDMRMAISNGAFQLGAATMIFPCDDVLRTYLDGRAREPFEAADADADASYAAVYDYDLSALDPLVAGPHEIDLVRPLAEVDGMAINAAYVGSCSSGRISDLRLAADVLRGRKVHPGVRMIVTPVSADTARDAAAEGLIQVFLDAGASFTQPGCGACELNNLSPLKLADGERCLSTSVEAVRGRMGSKDAEVMLGNAAVVAASAIEGRIADPARYLEMQP